MRIALVTANLEPGRDGIGDHCRRLAQALAEAGASPRLLALADRGVAQATAEHPATLRLPAALDWSARLAEGRRFLAGCDGVSLQLAPYLYHPKGLLGAATAPLAALLAGQRLQVTLHETWVGWYRTHGLGDRLVGWRQRRDLLALLRRLAPRALDTSLPVYARQLARHGLAARVRPVFGNLPAGPTPPLAGLEALLRDAGVEPGRALLVGTFGSGWPGWEPRAALAALQAAATAAGRRLVLLLIGHHGVAARRLAAWRDPGRTLLATGPLAPAEAAAALNAVSGVLAVTPYDLAGKSSALAACLEFGLPALTTWGAAPGPAPVLPAFQPLVLPPGADPAPLLARRPGSGPFRPQAGARATALLETLRG
jgi:hypothetical protein